MKNIINLVKINILSIFNFQHIKKIKTLKDISKPLIVSIIMLVAYIYLGFYIYFFAKLFMEGYQMLKIEYLLPTQFMVITSMIILFSSIYKIKAILFEFKDYDLLMSLPIDKKIIVISKLITLYLYNFIFALLIMIPSFIAYVKFTNITFLFVLYYFITLLIIPLVPIIIATFIGTLFSYIGSFFKKKNVIDMIISLGFIGLILYIQTKMVNLNQIDIANIGNSMINRFNRFYPLTNIYTSIIKDYNFISLLKFIFIPVILFTLYIIIINKLFIYIHYQLTNRNTNSNYKLKALKIKAPLKALYYKELKRYFASSIYVLNTAIMVIMLTATSISLIVFGTDKLDSFIGYPGFSNMLNTITPLIITLFCVMTCTTCTSISMEGKNLWIIKYLPLKPMNIFISKILVNLTITIPAIIINSIILGIYLKLNLFNFLLCLIIPFLYSLFTSLTGIFINLLFPSFNWDNEVKVIKQSLASLIGLFFNMIIGILSIVIVFKTKELYTNYILILISFSILILIFIAYYILKKYGQKKFIELN